MNGRVTKDSSTAAQHSCVAKTPWLDGPVPGGYWDIRENRVNYFDWLAAQKGFVQPKDWYGIRKLHLSEMGGAGLLRNYYGGSFFKAMTDYMPDYDWKQWLFGRAPDGYWSIPENRRHYMHWLGQQLGFTNTEDWYRVTNNHFHQFNGGGLLNVYFNGSIQAVLADFAPDTKWQPWLFASVPQSFWAKPENRGSYFTWLGERLGFVQPCDWTRLTRQDFLKNRGSWLLSGVYHGSISSAAAEALLLQLPESQA